MLKVYLIQTFYSLWQRKGFSVFLLLSIAISLMVVVCITAFVSILTSPIAPEVHKNETFYLHSDFRNKNDGARVINVAEDVLPVSFYTEQLRKLETAKVVTDFTESDVQTEFYLNKQKRDVFFRNTDAQFFTIYDFDFIEGKAYKESAASETVCVISQEIARFFFGDEPCVGKSIYSGERSLKITGVFKQSATITPVFAELYLLTKPSDFKRYYKYDMVQTAFLCRSSEDKKILLDEINKKASIQTGSNQQYNIRFKLQSSLEKLIDERYGSQPVSHTRKVAIVLLVLILPVFSLFELLKNNLQQRLEEMATRKAFGATTRMLVLQLVLENVLITILGGLLALLLSHTFYNLMAGNDLLSNIPGFFQFKSFLLYFGVFVVMGIISGILPAWLLTKNSLGGLLKEKK